MEFSIASEIGNIIKVENFIDCIVGLYQIESDVFGKINLCVIEAVSNAILYGNKQDASKYVRFYVEERDGYLYITIKDEGDGFNYSFIPDPTLPGHVEKDTGRGLFLMKILSDELLFEDNGATVILGFNIFKVNG